MHEALALFITPANAGQQCPAELRLAHAVRGLVRALALPRLDFFPLARVLVVRVEIDLDRIALMPEARQTTKTAMRAALHQLLLAEDQIDRRQREETRASILEALRHLAAAEREQTQ